MYSTLTILSGDLVVHLATACIVNSKLLRPSIHVLHVLPINSRSIFAADRFDVTTQEIAL